MSGLAGVIDFRGAPVEGEMLARMSRPVAHRGPHGCRIATGPGAGFCHLALHATPEDRLDAQPLRAAGRDVLLMADVRLDNREELLAALDLPGPPPGDAGLLLATYLRWGEACLDRLLGDFAFALWDAESRTLLCACDPLGVKPLHWARYGQLLLVASEARQILEHPAASPELDLESVGDFLAGNPERPGSTYFRTVHRLPPAHRLLATRLGERLAPYWRIDPERRTTYAREGEYAEHLREVLERAVRDRLRTPKPAVAVAMSGGLDSGSVAALAQRASGDSGPRVLACSFTFERLAECDERAAIREIADKLDLQTSWVAAEERPLLGDEAAFSPDLESPMLSWESCFAELLGRARQGGARVLLTGHGGDEVLGGSLLTYLDRLRRGDLTAVSEVVGRARRTRRDWRRALYRCFGEPLLSPRGRNTLRRLTGKPVPPALPAWLDPQFVRRTGLAERTDRGPSGRRFHEAARQEIHDSAVGWTDGGQSVYWYDRSAARHGMEARHPFLDRRLVELVISLPPVQLFEVDCYKPLLRRALVGILPESVLNRPAKARLGGYMDYSLREAARREVEELLAAPLAAEWGFVDARILRSTYRAYLNGSIDDDSRRLWYALCLELWLRKQGSRIAGMTELDALSRAQVS